MHFASDCFPGGEQVCKMHPATKTTLWNGSGYARPGADHQHLGLERHTALVSITSNQNSPVDTATQAYMHTHTCIHAAAADDLVRKSTTDAGSSAGTTCPGTT